MPRFKTKKDETPRHGANVTHKQLIKSEEQRSAESHIAVAKGLMLVSQTQTSDQKFCKREIFFSVKKGISIYSDLFLLKILRIAPMSNFT